MFPPKPFPSYTPVEQPFTLPPYLLSHPPQHHHIINVAPCPPSNKVLVVNMSNECIKASVINGPDNVRFLMGDDGSNFGYTPISAEKSREFMPGNASDINLVSIKRESGQFLCHLFPCEINMQIFVCVDGNFIVKPFGQTL